MTDNRTTIRNIDNEILEEARQIVRESPQVTMGTFVSDAIEYYIETLPFVDEVISIDENAITG